MRVPANHWHLSIVCRGARQLWFILASFKLDRIFNVPLLVERTVMRVPKVCLSAPTLSVHASPMP